MGIVVDRSHIRAVSLLLCVNRICVNCKMIYLNYDKIIPNI